MGNVYINYLAVIVSAIVSMGLGALWYSPVLFGKQWMALMGIDPAKMQGSKEGMNKRYAIAFVGNLVMVYVLAHFVSYIGVTSVVAALQLGFWVWLGFVATVTVGQVLWEGKSWKLYFILNSYQLLSLLISAVILGTWK